MSRFFTRERFGGAQIAAAIILLAFLGQCVWFCSRAPLTERELAFVLQGQYEWHHGNISFHDQASPITGLVASLPLINRQLTGQEMPVNWRWPARLPFIFVGILFGGSVWYVARRLYGNIGGFVALLLYSFSPWFIIHSATVQPGVIAGWGAFGIVFTSIGVAHSLYAPREVVLWNWKRILLLGVSLGVACGAQAAVILLVPIALAFMWYLVPERRAAATVIMLAACAIGAVVFWAAYGFHFASMWQGIRSSHVFQFSSDAYRAPITWTALGVFFLQQATVTFLLLISVMTFAVWKRARFFGTAAPLIVFAILIALGIGLPTQGAIPFYLMALPFALVFIAGVCTDLLESKYMPISFGVIVGVLIGHVLISIMGLLRM